LLKKNTVFSSNYLILHEDFGSDNASINIMGIMKNFLTTLLFIFPLIGNATYCEGRTDKQEIEEIILQITSKYFPNLSSQNILVKEFNSDAYFLQAKPKISTLVGRRKARKYFVEINKKLYDCSPGKMALESIIAHELIHINDYDRMTVPQIIALAGKYASKKARAKYERDTDKHVVQEGLGEGLIQYRRWIYQQLTPKELSLKRYYYLTPEEITELMEPY